MTTRTRDVAVVCPVCLEPIDIEVTISGRREQEVIFDRDVTCPSGCRLTPAMVEDVAIRAMEKVVQGREDYLRYGRDDD